MSETYTYVTEAKSADETIELGRVLGAHLKGGEIIRLIGDVGAGKTTFVRGLAEGIESVNHVSSPTFTVHKVYRGRITLYHYDFYRVGDDPAIVAELEELMTDSKTSLAVEWPESARLKLPSEAIDIDIKVGNEQQREFAISIPKHMDHIKLS